MKISGLVLFILLKASLACAVTPIYVLPVQSEVPFLSQMPGTNIFVSPGASAIFSGPVVINGKEFKKFPEPPLNPPDWAEGLKKRIEAAILAHKDLTVAKGKPGARYILRLIVTRFGKDQDGHVGVTYEGMVLEGKTEEAMFPIKGSAVDTDSDEEIENLTWPEFIENETKSSIGITAKRAADNLAETLSNKLSRGR